MRRDMRVDLCMHAAEDLISSLARLGVVVPRQPAPRVAKHGAVVDSGAEDGNTQLTRMQVEHYSMKRDLTIWKAAVTAVGAAMGYSVDQLIAGAAHVLQQQASDGEAATPGCSGSTAPSTPNPRAGARAGAPDSPGSKGDPPVSVGQGGAGTTNVDLGVVHPCPSPLPVPAKPLWSQKAAPVCVPFTHEAAHTVVQPGGTKPVVLAMPAKRKRDDTPSPGSDAEGAIPASKSKGNGQGRSSKWKGVRKEKRGRWSAKILFWEKDKPKRTQMRLGAYNKELEAATAYAAAVHVVKEGRRVSGTVELSDEERGLLKGCTLSAVKRLVRGRQWFRWTEWETALADCPEEDSGGEGETHSDSQDDQAADAHGGAAKEVDTKIEMGGVKKGVPEAQVGRGTPNELNEEEADTLDGVAEQGVASAAQGASQVTPQAAVLSSVGAGDEDVGSDGGGEDVPVRSKAVASVMADENPAAHDTAAKAPRPSVPDNPFVAMPSVSGQPASGSRREETSTNDNVVISRAELEALKAARDDGERRIARLEALLLSAQDPRTHNKRQRCSEDASSAEGDDVEAEAEHAPVRRVRKRRHMIEASSPILQEAFDFKPAGKAWKVRVHCLMRLLWQKHCDFVREYLFIERGNDAMTFYPSSYDKTLGLCWVTPRLTLKFAAVALAADKGRRDDLNKSLSQWKTEVAGRVRDIALPRIGLWRDERDAKSPWRRKEAREAAEVRIRYRVLDDVNEDLTLSTWSESKTGMIFASGAFTACAATAFRPKKVTGTVNVKLYQLAWLEHVVTDTILNWDKRKGRLSNSAGGNAQVVNGLQEVAAAAVAQAIQDFKPTYDADEAAWVWGEHGLMLSSDGLEHLVPGRYAHRAPVADDRASVSLHTGLGHAPPFQWLPSRMRWCSVAVCDRPLLGLGRRAIGPRGLPRCNCIGGRSGVTRGWASLYSTLARARVVYVSAGNRTGHAVPPFHCATVAPHFTRISATVVHHCEVAKPKYPPSYFSATFQQPTGKSFFAMAAEVAEVKATAAHSEARINDAELALAALTNSKTGERRDERDEGGARKKRKPEESPGKEGEMAGAAVGTEHKLAVGGSAAEGKLDEAESESEEEWGANGEEDFDAEAELQELCNRVVALEKDAKTWEATPSETRMDLSSCVNLTDAALSRLTSLRSLTWLSLRESISFTAEGLTQLYSLTSLKLLDLAETNATDASLEGISSLKVLNALYLGDTKITDAGIAKLRGLPALVTLALDGCESVTSASMVHVGKLTSLEALWLSTTAVGEDGLKLLTALTSLKVFSLPSGVTDVILKLLRSMKRLERLGLWDAKITVDGLKWLKGLKSLQVIATTFENVEALIRDSFPEMIVTEGPI
ncbi:unnamed protein product [Closterium sp. Yama58-4]|nr:unnamed protein product [Closterium sp. Yama58-4]